MGCTNPTSSSKNKPLSNQNQIYFSVSINEFVFHFLCDQETLNIKGYSDNKSELIYDTTYDDISLPQSIYKFVKSVKLLTQKIKRFENSIKIENDSLIITQKQNSFALPLISKNYQSQFKLEGNLYSEVIKKLSDQQKVVFPYNCAVLIKSHCGQDKIIQGSGAIIQKNTVLTVAHVVYNRTYELEAEQIFVYVQTTHGLKQLQVKKHYFPKEYKSINQTDLPKYDFAYLQLENNQIVTNQQILPIKWDWTDNYKKFQVIGFSQKLDKQQINMQTNQYRLKMNKAISLLENFIVYDGKAQSGISGGPIIGVDQDQKFKLIGLHQGFHQNFSRGILLSSFGKNAFQILTQMSSFNEQLQKILNPKQFQKQAQNKALKQQIQRLKLQKEQISKDKKQIQKQKQIINPHQKSLLAKSQLLIKKAENLLLKNKFQQSKQISLECLAIQQEYPGTSSLQYATTLHWIGRCQMGLKLYQTSIQTFRKSLYIKQKFLQKNSPKYMNSLYNIGFSYFNLKKYLDSLNIYQNCLQIIQKAEGKSHELYLPVLIQHGINYQALKCYNQALEYFFKCEKYFNDILLNRQQYDRLMKRFMNCFMKLKNYQKFQQYAVKYLQYLQKYQKGKNQTYALELRYVALDYLEFNKKKAIQMFLQCAQVLQNCNSTKTKQYTQILSIIIQEAFFLKLQNKIIIQNCQKVINTCQQNQNIITQHYLFAIQIFGQVLERDNKLNQALEQFKKLQKALSFLKESDQLQKRTIAKTKIQKIQIALLNLNLNEKPIQIKLKQQGKTQQIK